MATTFQAMSEPLVIPAVNDKIIRIERLIQTTHGTLVGSKLLRVRSNSSDILPTMNAGALIDINWLTHQPQGERGQSVVIDIEGNESQISAWVAYRYID